jgi:nucleoid-associated protein EbfC
MADFPFDMKNLDMSSVMKMATDIKDQAMKLEESLSTIPVESVVGGGMVTVKATARGDITSVSIDPELISMNDKQMLEDLVTAGVNSALMNAKQKREEKMQEMTGGMNIPGIFP